QLYEQIWKPYCSNFSNWRKLNKLNYLYSNNLSPSTQPESLSLEQQSDSS
ncbi:4696_t:CDS:1, partial [Ambispora leptoticha]